MGRSLTIWKFLQVESLGPAEQLDQPTFQLELYRKAKVSSDFWIDCSL
jgi:hypothetical protein